MKIIEVIVSHGCTIGNPYARYENFRPQVALKAQLDETDILEDVVKQLQVDAAAFVEQQKQMILDAAAMRQRVESERIATFDRALTFDDTDSSRIATFRSKQSLENNQGGNRWRTKLK